MTVVGGSATSIPVTSLMVGAHEVRALYDGDANFGPSERTLLLTISKAPTTPAVTSSQNPAGLIGSVTFTATLGGVPPGCNQQGRRSSKTGRPISALRFPSMLPAKRSCRCRRLTSASELTRSRPCTAGTLPFRAAPRRPCNRWCRSSLPLVADDGEQGRIPTTYGSGFEAKWGLRDGSRGSAPEEKTHPRARSRGPLERGLGTTGRTAPRTRRPS